MGRKKTHSEFVEEMKILNPEINVLGKYVNSRTKIGVKHTCGYQWEACPKCFT